MKKRTINEYRQVKDTVYVAPKPKGQPDQTINEINLKNMGFVEYPIDISSEPHPSYYREYRGVRLDAVHSTESNGLPNGWNVVIFHDVDPHTMTVIHDLDLLIELNNLLNKIHDRYDEAKGH